MTQYGVIFHYD